MHEGKWSCTLCPKKLSSSEALSMHMMAHNGEKPLKCPTCEKAFRQKNALRNHMLTHSGEKPFACDVRPPPPRPRLFAPPRSYHPITHSVQGPPLPRRAVSGGQSAFSPARATNGESHKC